jgi:hypothetical protein
MTMDVYAQVQQRAKRDRGAKFDKLVRDAREQLLTPHDTPRKGAHWDGKWDGRPKTGSQAGGTAAHDRH